jgi:hypothetical protein
MPIQATASLTVQISGAPPLSVPWSIKADAYDRASVTVGKGQKGTLELQPGTAGEILLLVIQSTDYTGNVTFQFGSTASWKIGEPQIVAGPGLMNAITKGGDPKVVSFDNTAGLADVTIDVLVVRTAMSTSST